MRPPRLTPGGTRVRLKQDLYDIDDDTGQRYLAAVAGETGTTVEQAANAADDMPDVVLDKPDAEGKQRKVIVDMYDKDEVEITAT